MSAKISLELLTPQQMAAGLEVTEATLPGSLGQFTVLPGHAPYVAQLKPGVLRLTGVDGAPQAFVIGSGFAEIVDDRLLILTRRVDQQSSLDGQQLRAQLESAVRRFDGLDPRDPEHLSAGEEVQRLRAGIELLSS